MSKSVYSIVLDDDVVAAADEMAYRMGTSRSNLINQIIAERVSFVTPEMRMREIFSLVEKALDTRFLPAPTASDSVMSVKTPLKFKYKPTVKYQVELFRSFSGCVGRLKVTLRTQSAELIAMCGSFFEFWRSLEQKYCGKLFGGKVPCEIAQKCYTRDLYEVGSGELSDREIAAAISGYIGIFDKALTLYFDNAEEPRKAAALCEQVYKQYLGDGVRVL